MILGGCSANARIHSKVKGLKKNGTPSRDRNARKTIKVTRISFGLPPGCFKALYFYQFRYKA